MAIPLPMPRPKPPSMGQTSVNPLPKFWEAPGFNEFAGNMLSDLGYGLTRGTSLNEGFQLATQRTAEMDGHREDARRKANELAQTKGWVEANYPEYANLPPAQAFEAAMSEHSAKQRAEMAGAPKPIEVNGQLVDPNTYEVLGDFRTPEQMGGGGKQPASVQEYEYAKSQGFAGSFTDYQTQMKQATRGPMNATTQKELFEAEDSATAGGYVLSALDEAVKLNDSAYDGPGAKMRGGATGLFGNAEGQATLRLDNLTTELALTQLKTIFGGMPTEGERKILLELQGSVDQPKAVRADIFKRARVMAERRIEDSKRKAAGLRSGDYFEEGYGQSAPPGGQTSGGVSWSVE